MNKKEDSVDQNQTARSVQSDLDLHCPQKLLFWPTLRKELNSTLSQVDWPMVTYAENLPKVKKVSTQKAEMMRRHSFHRALINSKKKKSFRLKSPYRPAIQVFVYKIQVNPIHTILNYGDCYDFIDR